MLHAACCMAGRYVCSKKMREFFLIFLFRMPMTHTHTFALLTRKELVKTSSNEVYTPLLPPLPVSRPSLFFPLRLPRRSTATKPPSPLCPMDMRAPTDSAPFRLPAKPMKPTGEADAEPDPASHASHDIPPTHTPSRARLCCSPSTRTSKDARWMHNYPPACCQAMSYYYNNKDQGTVDIHLDTPAGWPPETPPSNAA